MIELQNMAIYSKLKLLIVQKELREGRKLTYRTIAKETGVSTSTISSYITQKVDRFDRSTLEAFCKYFDCQPGDILVYSEEEPTNAL